VRFADLRSVTRSRTLPAPVSATTSLADVAEELVRRVLASHPRETAVTLVAVSVSGLDQAPATQLELPLGLADEVRRPGSREGAARLKADSAVDAIRRRFGREAVGYGTQLLGAARSVPDAFRHLAEKSL
jgi:DNA polymerase-4